MNGARRVIVQWSAYGAEPVGAGVEIVQERRERHNGVFIACVVSYRVSSHMQCVFCAPTSGDRPPFAALMPTCQFQQTNGHTALFLPLDALDVDQHDWLVVRDAILGNEFGEYSVHFEGLPRTRGRYNRCSSF